MVGKISYDVNECSSGGGKVGRVIFTYHWHLYFIQREQLVVGKITYDVNECSGGGGKVGRVMLVAVSWG